MCKVFLNVGIEKSVTFLSFFNCRGHGEYEKHAEYSRKTLWFSVPSLRSLW